MEDLQKGDVRIDDRDMGTGHTALYVLARLIRHIVRKTVCEHVGVNV